MKALDLLVVQCGRKVAECRDQLMDGIEKLLPGHSTPAISGGHDDRRPAPRVRRGAAPQSKTPLGGSESRLQGAGARRIGCDRVSCPACQYVRMARLWGSEHRVPSSQLHPRGAGSRADGQDRLYRQCNCAPHLADRSASLDTWLERTSRTITTSPALDCLTPGRAVQHRGCEVPPCRCVEAEQRKRALQRSKSLRDVPLLEHRQAWVEGVENQRGLRRVGEAVTQAVMGAIRRQDVRVHEVRGPAAALAHPAPRHQCRHGVAEAGHAVPRTDDVKQFVTPSSAFQPVTNRTAAGHTCSLQAKQYHAVGYPAMPLAAPADCHLPRAPRHTDALSAAEAQRHHIDHEMETRFLLGRSATVDVLEESLGGGEVATEEAGGGCGCLAGPRPPQEGHLPAADWRPRVKSISDPNIPLNVADGGPAAEESNKSLGRAGAARPPPPTRTKRTEIYMELRPARGGAPGTPWEDVSEEEHSISLSSSKAASSSGRQTPLGYAADCPAAPTPDSSSPSSSSDSSQDSLSEPELADAATQTPAPAPAALCLPRSITGSNPSTALEGPASPSSPRQREAVPPTYWEAAGPVAGALGPQQAGAEACEAQHQQQQHPHEHQWPHHSHPFPYHLLQHQLQLCTCRKVRREAVVSPPPPEDLQTLPRPADCL